MEYYYNYQSLHIYSYNNCVFFQKNTKRIFYFAPVIMFINSKNPSDFLS